MKKDLNKFLQNLINEERTVLNYLKSKYPLFHRSNVFYRDLQFGIKHYLENREIKLTYTESEELANLFIDYLISKGILKKINEQIYLLNYPDFVPQKTMQTKA